MNENNTCILIVSFDGYSDVWYSFFYLLNKYWNDNPYPVYLVSNYKTINSNNINSILIGDETNWCDRVYKALNQVKEENIILLLDDYLIGDFVRTHELVDLLSQFEKLHLDYLRIINIPTIKNRKGVLLKPIMRNDEYGISLQPAIWRKDFLKKALVNVVNTRSAWEFEIYFLKQCTERNESIDNCFFIEKNLLHIHNGILQGKWFGNEIRYFKKRGLDIDTSKRGILPYSTYLLFLLIAVRRFFYHKVSCLFESSSGTLTGSSALL